MRLTRHLLGWRARWAGPARTTLGRWWLSRAGGRPSGATNAPASLARPVAGHCRARLCRSRGMPSAWSTARRVDPSAPASGASCPCNSRHPRHEVFRQSTGSRRRPSSRRGARRQRALRVALPGGRRRSSTGRALGLPLPPPLRTDGVGHSPISYSGKVRRSPSASSNPCQGHARVTAPRKCSEISPNRRYSGPARPAPKS